MRVAMIDKTLVVAVLQLSRRRVYDVSIREPTPTPDVDVIITDMDILPRVIALLDDTLTVNVFTRYW